MNLEQIMTQGQIATALLVIALGVVLHLVWIMIRDTRDRNRQPR